MTENIQTQDSLSLVAIAEQFTLPGKVTGVQAFGSGNINDTFLVTLDAAEKNILSCNALIHRCFGSQH